MLIMRIATTHKYKLAIAQYHGLHNPIDIGNIKSCIIYTG